MSNSRSIGIIVASVVALIGLAVVVVLLAGRRGPEAYPIGSPEAALQAYLVAWDDGDVKAAYAALSRDAHRSMSFGDYQRAARQWRSGQSPQSTRTVLIDRTEGGGDRRVIYLIVEETYGNGLEQGSYRSERQVELVREDGAWRMSQPLVWLDPAEAYKY